MRIRSARPLALLALAFAVLAGSADSSDSQGALTQKVLPVLSTSDAVGKVTPCGCHTPKGGFARIASVIDSTKIKYGDALVVDAGDFAPEATNPIEVARIEFQFKSMELLGYDAIGIGERELNFGYDKLKALAAASKVPVLSANLVDKKTGRPAFKPWVIVKKGNLKVGVFSVLGPKIELPANAGEQLTVDDPLSTAQKTVAELRKQCDVVVALAHLGRVEGEDLAAQVPGIDVVILAHHPGYVAQGRRVNSAVTVASGEQIQNMGVSKVMLDGRKVLDLASESLILMPEVGERSDIARLVKDFEDGQNEKLRKQQQSDALHEGEQAPGGDRYLGSEACASCHAEQFAQWQTTQHAHAFATLQRVSKESTPECVQCHVVGYTRPTGYVNAEAGGGGLQNVGCEACHGMGTRHSELVGTGGKVAEAVCQTCHQPANDTGWNYAAKLPRISH